MQNENDLMDLTNLIRLKEALEISNNNTSSMIWKLKDFDSRLLALDKKMLPIQNVEIPSSFFSFLLLSFLFFSSFLFLI